MKYYDRSLIAKVKYRKWKKYQWLSLKISYIDTDVKTKKSNHLQFRFTGNWYNMTSQRSLPRKNKIVLYDLCV